MPQSKYQGWLLTYKGNSDYYEAIKAFQIAVDKHPMSELYFIPADTHLTKANYEEALTLIETAGTKYDASADTCAFHRSRVYMKKGDFDGAIKALEIAVEGNPTRLSLRRSLGKAHLAKGNYELR
jgi:tetratricopeptide (TPR) repeat protein